MNIKQFIDEYKNCPFCHHSLVVSSDSGAHVTVSKNRLTISMKSDYFIEPNIDIFEFSISIINGNMLHTNSANQFVSLYDLNIYLQKYCTWCGVYPQSFSRSINIFYDRTKSSFSSEPYMEHFSFTHQNIQYIIINNYNTRASSLLTSNGDSKDKATFRYTKIPYVPFEKFDFSNKEKLFSKINSIALLA